MTQDSQRGRASREGPQLGDDQPLPTRSPFVVYKPVSAGGVLFSTETEVYFGVNQLGERIWELLPPMSTTVGGLCAILVSEHADVSEARIREDVRLFLRALADNGLVVTPSADVGHDPAI
ncbi:MAG TPA: PqqD family protein [Gemmatimonadaceae bacterium]|nr:PqqD family protein [Gemmatimonadaceae bacterium]